MRASNLDAQDQFGFPVSLSADGDTLAVGALYESSAATGINGNQSDNSAEISGAVYVFVRVSGNWQQQAYVKASNTDEFDRFGATISLSADGNTLAVAAPLEDGDARGLNGFQNNNVGAPNLGITDGDSGAVYVFKRTNGTWHQQAYVKASNTGQNDFFGSSLSLSANGTTMAVGAKFEDSASTGIDGNQDDNSAANAGAVYLY